MNQDLTRVVVKLLPSIGILIVVTVIVYMRGLSWTADLKLLAPRIIQLLLWISVWSVWLVAAERISGLLGLPAPVPWGEQGLISLALRFIGLVVLAPLTEELMFRSLLYGRIEMSVLGVVGAVILPALIFAAFHTQYSFAQRVWILIDGLFFGLARWDSETVTVPIIMHVMGNAYAYWQRFPK